MPVPASAEKIKPRITAARRRARRRLQRDSSSSGSDQSSSEEEEERSDDSGHEDDDFRQQFGPDLPPGDGNKGDKPDAAASALPLPPAKVTPKPKTRKERASLFSLFPFPTTQRTGGPPLVLNSEMARAFVLSVRSSGRAAPPSGRAFALSVLGNGPLFKAAATAQSLSICCLYALLACLMR